MTKRWLTYFLFAALGALAILLVANLLGYGPAIVRYERTRIVAPPQRLTQKQKPVHLSVSPATPCPADWNCGRGWRVGPAGPAIAEPKAAAVSQTPSPMPPVSKTESRSETNILSGNTLELNLNIEVLGSRGGYGYHGGYYGGTSWVPGYAVRVCEPYPTGCYDKWIPAHYR